MYIQSLLSIWKNIVDALPITVRASNTTRRRRRNSNRQGKSMQLGNLTHCQQRAKINMESIKILQGEIILCIWLFQSPGHTNVYPIRKKNILYIVQRFTFTMPITNAIACIIETWECIIDMDIPGTATVAESLKRH